MPCSWQNWEPLSVDNWILLCKKQRRLHDIEIGPTDRPLAPVLEKEIDLLASSFENVDSLNLYPDKLDRLLACQKLLKAKPKVSKLFLTSGFQYVGETIPDDLHDTSTRPGLFTRTMFRHMLPFESCTPMVLKSVSFDSIELRYAADTYMKIMNFHLLEDLEIHESVKTSEMISRIETDIKIGVWAQMCCSHSLPNPIYAHLG